MPERKIPEVLSNLVEQMRNTINAPKPDASGQPATNFVFQVGQGGVVQFVLGSGVFDRPREAGREAV